MKHKLITIGMVALVLLSGCSSVAELNNDESTTEEPTPIVQNETTTTSETTVARTTLAETTSTNRTTVPNQTQTVTETVTETKTITTSAEATPTATEEPKNIVTVKAVGEGTSHYRVYVPGSIELGPETEKTDKTVSDVLTYAQGITGEGAKDVYILGRDLNPGIIVNDGNATLDVFHNGKLHKTVEPGAYVDEYGPIGPQSSSESTSRTATPTKTPTSTETNTPTTTETPTSTETETNSPTPTPTPTETETSTPTPTPEPTLDTENMKKIEVQSLEQESVSYAFSASGTVYLGEETSSEARAEGQKGSGAVSDYETDTFYIQQDKKVIEVRNRGQHPIRVTIDGESVDVSDGPDVDKSNYLSNSTIRIEAVGSDQTDYEFAVSGDAFQTGESDSANAVYPDEIDQEYVMGTVGDGGSDKFKYTGELEAFFNFGDGTLKVYVDGKLIGTVEDGGSLRVGTPD